MKKQKRLLLLGGLRYLIPVIEAAHKEGYYVITCDYLPNNIAHKFSDEYHNVSIIDKDAVLKLAQELQIDGVMSFAVDPGVVTAAYVQEKMGLPAFGPYESVCILQNKDRFRAFLTEHGFNTPKAKGFSSVEEALNGLEGFEWPLIIKPTDSAGSKGVTKVDNIEQLKKAIEHAFEHSFSNRIIIEEFIEQEGCSSDSDSFSVDGELKFISFSAQRFDVQAANPYTPSAFSWPSTMSKKQEIELTSELQRLLTLLGMKTSIYNVETRVGKNGKPYIMEVSPRGGGNRLSEMLRLSTGIDLIANAVRAAVGDKVIDIEQKPYNGHWAEIILHADKDGYFEKLDIDQEFYNRYVKQVDLWVKKNDKISAFRGANDAIGTLVLRFENESDIDKNIYNQKKWLKIITK
ncbi:ATP-grasp domain-containing protein [Bacteroides mediterraneensis]|uniref:ATP-grasp domain-containing protein n=1 Tax=Bacteroides mediterraneensis TaxID=1841856 RepID=UPI00195DF9E0|nr:ATP-grasp domain-containing protein [Bacteroides mediterraneensis]MBM6781264.1 ATP-grasp domain-containing protein [Bacteroides mediterraneensis]